MPSLSQRLQSLKPVLGRSPLAACCAAAVSALLLTLALGFAIALQGDLQQLETAHRLAAAPILRSVDEAHRLGEQLSKNFSTGCDEGSLTKLRVQLSLSEHISDVGVVDGEGQIRCMATIGQLAEPMPLPTPEYVRDVNGHTRYTYFRFPAFGTDGRVKVFMSRTGNFVLVISPAAYEQVRASGIDAARWLSPAQTQHALYEASSLTSEQHHMLSQPGFTQQRLRMLSWSQRAFIAVSPVEGTRYVVQSFIPLWTLIARNATSLLLVLTAAILAAMLVYMNVANVMKRWSGLEYRIDSLVREDNIVCMFQPIVELRSSRVVGCEVLMRLKDGDAVIYPDQAIPAVVAAGLTWQLDQAVIRAAVKQLSAALPADASLKVAFNVFPENVKSQSLQALFESVRQGLPQDLKFDIEVIEQHYRDSIIEEVAQLKALDFLISVDDFGTGYSNLGVIRQLSPNFLKIDRSFVMEMEEASVRSSLIPEIVAIARAVKAEVVAEGIENETQRALLQDQGVEYGQGYHFARPLPIADFVAFFRKAEAAG